ncbi:hypothetical protein ACYX7E_14590 [Luteimonas sp. RIT-PG2_3]
MRLRTATWLFSCLLLAHPAFAQDSGDNAAITAKLESVGVKFEVDGDGDFKSVYNYEDEGRTQLVFVSGKVNELEGIVVREVFSPAANVPDGGFTSAQALKLLADSQDKILGAWEVSGSTLLFVVKLPDNADGKAFETAMDVAAAAADDMEIALTNGADEY